MLELSQSQCGAFFGRWMQSPQKSQKGVDFLVLFWMFGHCGLQWPDRNPVLGVFLEDSMIPLGVPGHQWRYCCNLRQVAAVSRRFFVEALIMYLRTYILNYLSHCWHSWFMSIWACQPKCFFCSKVDITPNLQSSLLQLPVEALPSSGLPFRFSHDSGKPGLCHGHQPCTLLGYSLRDSHGEPLDLTIRKERISMSSLAAKLKTTV